MSGCREDPLISQDDSEQETSNNYNNSSNNQEEIEENSQSKDPDDSKNAPSSYNASQASQNNIAEPELEKYICKCGKEVISYNKNFHVCENN